MAPVVAHGRTPVAIGPALEFVLAWLAITQAFMFFEVFLKRV